MKIAITGASGFVGSAAAAHAEDRGHDVVRILRPSADPVGPNDLHADLADLAALSTIAAQVDAILHCAASDNPSFLRTTEAASHAFIAGLPKGGRFAMHGGSVVFGDTGKEAVEHPEFAPPPPLAARATFERGILEPERPDVRTRIVYGSLIYGGAGAVIPSVMIRVAMEAGDALYFEDGGQIWSSAHVTDFGRLLVDAVEGGPEGNTYLFAAGRAVPIKSVADIIGRVLGLSSRPVSSESEAGLFGMFAGAFRMNQHFGSQVARSSFGWRPEASDDGSALAGALAYHASHESI